MLILYSTDHGKSRIQLGAKDQTVSLSQREAGQFLDVSTDSIALHLKNLYETANSPAWQLPRSPR